MCRLPHPAAALARLLILLSLLSLLVAAMACSGPVPRPPAPTAPSSPLAVAPAGPAANAPALTDLTSPAARATALGYVSAPLGTAPAPPAPPQTPGRPAWLGTVVLPLGARGYGQVQPTPPELVDRRFAAVDVLPPPPDDAFAASVGIPSEAVLARSTWSPGCPVAAEDLRHLVLAFWGFDDRRHTGELLVNAAVAEDVVEVFRSLHAARFPLEEVGITTPAQLDAPPTGDGNATAAFVCRPSRGGASWSQHAHGLAIDVNPFQNPYHRGDVVLPELASAYLDRSAVRPGMILPGDSVTTAFAGIGWTWGGTWRSLTDAMHFSRDGT